MIIGIAGKAGSGKSTIADYLVKNHQFVAVSLADPIKRICRDVFDFSEEQLWGPSEKRNEADQRYPRFPLNPLTMAKEVHGDQVGEYRDTEAGRVFVPRYLTPRHALQQIGTEWGRDCYPNIWVEYTLRMAKKIMYRQEHKTHHMYYDPRWGLYPWNESSMKPIKGVVIPDVRFENEVAALTASDAKVWRIHRSNAGLAGAAGQHQSETELDSIPKESFSIHLYNDNTLEALYGLVDKSVPRGS
jgi:hypothetical protein